jgi:U3 small nucleolar RNA-associated protein 23
VITQCSIRHLYADKDAQDQIATAKTFERRRCGHHTLEKPLSTLECLRQVVDPNDNKTNKHRYVVASQGADVRAHMRQVAGVPLLFIKRSVMILEPMAESTGLARLKEEKMRFRVGLRATKSSLGKRAREGEGDGGADNATAEARKKRQKGPKGPNPLSALKPKKRDVPGEKAPERHGTGPNDPAPNEDAAVKKKRRRKSSKRTDGGTEDGEA